MTVTERRSRAALVGLGAWFASFLLLVLLLGLRGGIGSAELVLVLLASSVLGVIAALWSHRRGSSGSVRG